MFLEIVLAFSWHETKTAKMPHSSDAPNMMPVPNNPTAPATAVAIGSARLVRSFLLNPAPFRNEDTSRFILFRSLSANEISFFFLPKANLP